MASGLIPSNCIAGDCGPEDADEDAAGWSRVVRRFAELALAAPPMESE
jgi:hypothetical protein